MPKSALPALSDPPGALTDIFEYAFLHAAVAMAIGTLDGRIVGVNSLICELVGRTEDELLSMSWQQLTHRDDVVRQERTMNAKLASGDRTIQIEKRYVRPDGRTVWVHTSGSLIPESEGRPPLYFIQALDISRRKRHEERLRKTLDTQRRASRRLRELDRLKNDFVAMVAHDLRSPIAAVEVGLDGLERAWHQIDGAAKLDAIRNMRLSLGSVGSLVENVLDVATIESGALLYDVKPFDLAVLARHTVEEHAALLGPERFFLVIELGLPLARGDEVRQWQVLGNLLANAVKFSPEGRPVEVTVTAADDLIHVTVCDHGVGIEADDLPTIFDRFTRRGDHARPGSGLGLYICKALVVGQGGTIDVESEPGAGSTFHYTVPAAQGGWAVDERARSLG